MYQQVCQLAHDAGTVIMDFYQGRQPLQTQQKTDNSLVTTADIAAHQLIVNGLNTLTPDIPVLSEEAPPPWQQRQHWERYWLVDPLDGTREFLQGNGEFTVNIALIEHGQPLFGVVYVPVSQTLYSAIDGIAWKQQSGQCRQIQVCRADPPIILTSRYHDPALQHWLAQFGDYQQRQIGSSLKFCLVAEGQAQFYPRFGAIHTWDTAAGHALVLAAGARVEDWQGQPLDYTPRESLLNTGFKVFISG